MGLLITNELVAVVSSFEVGLPQRLIVKRRFIYIVVLGANTCGIKQYKREVLPL